MKTIGKNLVDTYKYSRHIPILGFIKKYYIIAGSDPEVQEYFEERYKDEEFGEKAYRLTLVSSILDTIISTAINLSGGYGIDRILEQEPGTIRTGEFVGVLVSAVNVGYNIKRAFDAIKYHSPSQALSIANIVINYANGVQKNTKNVKSFIYYAMESQNLEDNEKRLEYKTIKLYDKHLDNMGFL